MRTFLPWLAAVAFGVAASATAEEVTSPRFEDHPASEIYREAPAPLDVVAATAWKSQRSLLRKAAANGPNFAGSYTIASYNCGHLCQQIVVLDARTGKAVGDLRTRTGARYRLDSRLLVANPPESILAGDKKTRTAYLVWGEGTFLELKEAR